MVDLQVFQAMLVQGVSVDDIKNKILSAEGPKANNATQPDYVKFHDDKVGSCSCPVLSWET